MLQDHYSEKRHKICAKLYGFLKKFSAVLAVYYYMENIRIFEVIRWDMAKKM